MNLVQTIMWLALGFILGATGMWLLLQNSVRMKTQKIHQLERDVVDKQIAIAGLEVRLSEGHKSMEEKLTLLNESKDQMKIQFQSLANQIMEEKSRVFSQQNKESIDGILSPLREQLGEFRKRTEDLHIQQEASKAALVNEIGHLKSLGLQISQDANNLTGALKGDNKTQGNWGELVLERVLEMSGLERGREYETQFHAHDSEGNRLIPDAIVRLPQAKDVVLDSKISLIAYEKYCSAKTEKEQAEALKSHVLSIRQHIKILSDKKYDELPEIRSLDYVLMFIPIEGAFAAALKADNQLFSEAFARNIILCSPSSLLAVLKTIAFTWRVESQTKNAQEIAEKSGNLLDKCVSFLETMQEIGDAIHRSGERYDTAIKVLSTGKGNLIRRAEELQALGVKGRKEIPKELLHEDPSGQIPIIEGETL